MKLVKSEESFEPDGLLENMRAGNVLNLSGVQSNKNLLLGAPQDGSFSEREDVARGGLTVVDVTMQVQSTRLMNNGDVGDHADILRQKKWRCT